MFASLTLTRKPLDELSDRELRERLKRANGTIAEIDAADAREVVRSGRADETLARLEAAIDTVQEAEQELRHHRRASSRWHAQATRRRGSPGARLSEKSRPKGLRRACKARHGKRSLEDPSHPTSG
jgi:hypothetical protein